MSARKYSMTAFIFIALCGCSAARTTENDAIGAPYLDHPNAGVKYPARVGGGLGAIVGIPLVIICLPVTVPVALITDQNMVPVAPLVGTSFGFATLFGSLTWPFFGWWKYDDA